MAILTGCETDVQTEEPANDVDAQEEELPPVEDLAEQITVEEFEYTLQNGVDRIVSGVVYNPTRRSIRHAEVRVGFYDDDNVLVETISVPMRDIAAGERKRFRYTVDTAVDYPAARVRDIMVIR